MQDLESILVQLYSYIYIWLWFNRSFWIVYLFRSTKLLLPSHQHSLIWNYKYDLVCILTLSQLPLGGGVPRVAMHGLTIIDIPKHHSPGPSESFTLAKMCTFIQSPINTSNDPWCATFCLEINLGLVLDRYIHIYR